MALLGAYAALITFIAAELLLLLLRAREIEIIAKRRSQRTRTEQQQVNRGLLRSILLEVFLFVPSSTTLVLLTIAPLTEGIQSTITVMQRNPEAFYALLGLISYGFPFAALRKIITRMALKTLREFALLLPEEIRKK